MVQYYCPMLFLFPVCLGYSVFTKYLIEVVYILYYIIKKLIYSVINSLERSEFDLLCSHIIYIYIYIYISLSHTSLFVSTLSPCFTSKYDQNCNKLVTN